jgi:hypothetical protein
MTMAPNRGVQPCVIRGLTSGLREVKIPHAVEDMMIRTMIMSDSGVGRLMRTVETPPKRESVKRSPREAATGGAILSKRMVKRKVGYEFNQNTCQDLASSADRGR